MKKSKTTTTFFSIALLLASYGTTGSNNGPSCGYGTDQSKRTLRRLSVHPPTRIMDLIWLRMSWWIKGWDSNFSYAPEEILRNPLCLMMGAEKMLTPTMKHVEWQHPEDGMLKWNVDASLIVHDDETWTAIGGALRDHNRNILCLFSIPIQATCINEAELEAIRKALELTRSRQWPLISKIIVESDSVNAIKSSSNEEKEPWAMAFTTNTITAIKRLDQRIEIKYKSRETNHLADGLAKLGNSKRTELIAWLE